MNLDVIEIKPFVPCSDMARATAFYLRLGFELGFASDELTYIRYGSAAFLLAKFSPPGFIGNYMMHLLVADADAWYAHAVASRVVEDFGAKLLEPPTDRPWGLRDFAMADPSGVLWRVGQNRLSTDPPNDAYARR